MTVCALALSTVTGDDISHRAGNQIRDSAAQTRAGHLLLGIVHFGF